MNRSTAFSLPLLIMLALMVATTAMAQSRVARVTKGIFLYSNWDAPWVTLDTCLDMTITEVHIPASIEHNGRTYPVCEIGHGAFQGCHNLTTVYFNVLMDKKFGLLRDAFHDCPNLRVLVCPSREPVELFRKHPFYGGTFLDVFEPYHAQTVVVVVPPGCEEAYRNAPGWCNFRNIQSTMPTDTQLQENDRERRIMQLESQLEHARAEVLRLEQELNKLKP